MKDRPVEQWGSRLGIILAVMGSAIGLGNFLRFPGLASRYEGGAFMIPYFIAFLLLGLPIAWAEWAMGRRGGQAGYNSAPGIFRTIWPNRSSPYFGVLGLLIPVGIYTYYVFIEAWCLYYAYQYFVGMTGMGPGLDLGRSPEVYTQFFVQFTGQKANGANFMHGLSPAAIALGICFILNFVFIYRGLQKGIELVCRYAIPALFVCALLVLARVLTLGTPDPSEPEQNLLNGLGFMWNPGTADKTLWQSLSNARMWLEAAGQIFFSLSVGFGIIITYSSYLKKNEDVLLSGTTSASGNLFAEVALGGMITIPAAFMFLGAAGAQGSTFDLGFKTLPNVFAYMPLGQFFGFLWFSLLFLAAITSSLSMLQPAIAFFEEGLGVNRRASVTILGLITLMGSLFVVYFSQGLIALDTMDFWVGSFAIYILATVEVILFGWVIGAKKGLAEAEQGSLLKLPGIVAFVIKYVAPLYLLTVFYFWTRQNLMDYVELFRTNQVSAMTMMVILIFTVFFLLLIATAVRRWKKMEART